MNEVPPNEAKIVWIVPLDSIDYVRSVIFTAPHRVGPPRGWRKKRHGRLIGYSELLPNAPGIVPACFKRRLFWLADSDRCGRDSTAYVTGCPWEARDPRTIEPNTAGTITDRAWGAARGGSK